MQAAPSTVSMPPNPASAHDASPPADTAPGRYSVHQRWIDSDPGLPKLPLPEYAETLFAARQRAFAVTWRARKVADIVEVATGKLVGWYDRGQWVQAAWLREVGRG